MNLPPELIDEIISCLPLDEPQALRNCSLVSKSWIYPSRKRLFEGVHIRKSDYNLWTERISPENVGLLHHVRSLTYVLDMTVWFRHPEYRIDSLGSYLPLFDQLENLGLFSVLLLSDTPHQIEHFSAFRHTLSSLSLRGCHVSSSALITILNYFPSLVNLELRALVHEVDGEPIPPLSRPLRGGLSVQQFRDCDVSLLDRLSDPPPECDELVIRGFPLIPVAYDRVVVACAGNVKRLGLLRGFEPVNQPTLSHCRELRELELWVSRQTRGTEILITSITSTNLQRIVFSVQALAGGMPLSEFVKFFDTADGSLSQLVEKLHGLGYSRTLEVEFLVSSPADGEVESGFAKLLPKFRKKGRVRVIQKSAGRAVHRSDG